MQRQAVPLIETEAPIIGTGMEHRAAKDSGVCVVAENDGIVDHVAGDRIVVLGDDDAVVSYPLKKYTRSNQGTCINQRPLVKVGDTVKSGDIIADGPSVDNGELALGRNVLIGFMMWEGFNYEDAILLSERSVSYTHLDVYKRQPSHCSERSAKHAMKLQSLSPTS